jgi:hypothetical protein
MCRWVRRLARKGWSAGDIASLYHVSKADVLSMLAPVAVKPPNPKRPGACFKKHNAWSDAALEDPRPDPASGVSPVAESWGSVHASGPRKITAAVLDAAIKLHQDGWSRPAIAEKFGCHRMAFYHALRRPPR